MNKLDLRIISGGQDGADIAATRTAKRLGFATGGEMPRGFLTVGEPVNGRPEYAELYGMTENASPAWSPRTKANVQNADVTVFIGLRSRGYYATLKAAQESDKPFLHLFPRVLEADTFSVADLARQLAGGFRNCRTVNFAGNRDLVEARVERFCTVYFSVLFGQLNVYEQTDNFP